MKNKLNNKFILFFATIISMFAVLVAGFSTYAWFQQRTVIDQYDSNRNQEIDAGGLDLDVKSVTGYKYIYDDTGSGINYNSGHVASYAANGEPENINQDTVTANVDAPGEGVGYYIKGDSTWALEYGNGNSARSFASAVRMEDKYGENFAFIGNMHFVVDEQIKIRHHYFNSSSNATNTAVTDYGNTIFIKSTSTNVASSTYYVKDNSYENIIFKTSGYYNIWVTNNNGNPKVYMDYLGAAAPSRGIVNKTAINRTVSISDYNKKIRVYFNDSGWSISNIAFSNDGSNFSETTSFNSTSSYTPKTTNPFASNNTSVIDLPLTTSGKVYFRFNQDGARYYLPIYNGYSGNYPYQPDVFTNAYIRQSNSNTQYTFTPGHVYKISIGGHVCENNYWGNIYKRCWLNITDYGAFHVFDNNSYGGSTTKTIEEKTGNFNLPARDSVSHYTLNGWSTSSTGGSVSAVGTAITAYKTPTYWYARYSETAKATITKTGVKFKGDGSTSTFSIGTDTPYIDDAYTPSDPSEDYYEFNGWFTDSHCTEGHEFTSGQNQTTDIEIFARFDEISYSITRYQVLLDGTPNSSEMNITDESTQITSLTSVTAYSDTSITLTKPADIANYSFLGWGEAYDDSNLETSYTIPHISTDLVLYAVYRPTIYTFRIVKKGICYDSQGSVVNISGYSEFTAATQTGINWYTTAPLPVEQVTNLTGNNVYKQRTDSSSHTRFVYKRDGKFYTHSDFTDAHEYKNENLFTISGTSDKTLYCKFVQMENETIYIQDGLGANSLTYPDGTAGLAWQANTTLYANVQLVENKNIQCDNFGSATGISLAHSWYRYYKFTGPKAGMFLWVSNGQWSTATSVESSGMGVDSSVKITTNEGDRGTKNMVSLWRRNISGDCEINDYGKYQVKYSWSIFPGEPSSSGYYIVGDKEFTKSEDNAWTFNSAVEMTIVNRDHDGETIVAERKSVNLVEGMQLQIWYFDASAGSVTKYNGENLATSSDDGGDTLDVAYDNTDDNSNIKINAEVSGKFNIYIVEKNSRKYISIEDANKAGYIFFLSPTGDDSKSVYKMGAGDNYHNKLVYERGINVSVGDKFAIRNRYKGKYSYYGYGQVGANQTSILKTSGSASTVGDSEHSSSVTTIEFKVAGLYSFYLGNDDKVYVASVAPTGYGYYILENPDKENVSTLTFQTTEKKMRAVSTDGSTKNIAQYTNFHVGAEGGTYSFKGNLYHHNYGTETLSTENFYHFYDVRGLCSEVNSEKGYITLREGDYDFYVYIGDDGNYYVSIEKSNTSSFFNMNSLPLTLTSQDDIFECNTTFVIDIEFSVPNNTAINITMDNLLTSNTGLSTSCCFAYFLDTEIPSDSNPYRVLRKQYTSLAAYNQLNNAVGTIQAGDTKPTHHAYIMIDYAYSASLITNLQTKANLANNFYFKMRATQA